MNKTLIFLFAASITALLGACGKPAANTAPPAAATPPFVAIARGRVDVQGGLVHVAAARDGIVAELLKAVGDDVTAGEALMTLDTTQVRIALDAAKAELNAAIAQGTLLRAKRPGFKQRAARMSEAAAAGAATGQAADDATQALAELEAEIAVADANIATAQQKVRQAEYEIEARILRAPVPGRIIVRATHIGDVVSPSSGELIELLPDAPRIVRAELNEGFVSKVREGMNAEITSEADPGTPQRARVIRISEVFGASTLNESAQEATDARDVECILEFLSNNDFRIGQRVQVRFLPN
ncbi:MAG: HlyD family efflux transporter periplasmic adaptor subunit [Pseudomonadales bacterium]|jgi:multidrug resistance efflux pump|nr:HlyD family efflux transporter periplasmic adaptor subunit [Pseudomonadales bacterium]